MLSNLIQHSINRIIHHDQEFIPGKQGWFNLEKTLFVIHYINRIKNKIHVIISLDGGGESFDKIQYHFMVKKTLNKLRIEGKFLNWIKDIYKRPTANGFSLNGERLNAFPQTGDSRQGN